MHHIIITTSGRSGSHRLHDFMDYHERTNCRSEITRLASVMGDLPQDEVLANLPDDFLDLWNAAIRKAAVRHSARDRMMTEHKSYLKAFPTNLEVRLFRKRRLRRLVYGIRTFEWKIPRRWLIDAEVEHIIPTFKGSRISWLEATHDVLPQQYVIHGIRNPGPYLNSWWNRFALKPGRDQSRIYADIKTLAGPLIAALGHRPLDEEFSQQEMLRGQLHLWREKNGRLNASLRHSDRYLLLDYDDVSADPLAAARQMYAHCQLEFDDRHAARITGGKKAVFNNPHAERLDEAMVRDIAADALDGFALADRYLKT